MITVLPVGAPARKKLDAVRAQIVKVDAQLESYDYGAAILPVDEAVERAVNAFRPLLGQARFRVLGFRQAGGGQPAALEDLLVLFTDDELRQRFAKLFQSDGLGEGVPMAKSVQQHAALKAQRLELVEQAYLLAWDLMEQGLYVEFPASLTLSPGLLPRVAEQLAQR